MARWFSLFGVLCVLVIGCAATPSRRAPAHRKPADEAAMREAIRTSEASGENYSSSASYAHFLKSRLLHHEGDHRAAADELRLALVTDPGNPYLLVALAEEYARLGDLARAEKTARAAIEKAPDFGAAQLLMGRVLAERRKLSRARVHLRRAARLSPSNPESYLMLSQVEMESNRPDAAIEAMEAMSRALPGDSRGFRLLGQVFADRGDVARSERMFRRAVETFPGDFDAWSRLAQLYESTDRLAQAEEAYAEALQRNPDSVELLMAAGKVSLRLGQEARARALFDRVLSLTDDPETAVRISFAWLTADRVEAAVDVLDRARERASGAEPRLSYYSALMHEKLHAYGRAAEAYAAIPESSDLFLEARTRRANALSLDGQHARALDEFRRLQKLSPDYTPQYPLHARALERSGRLEEAERLLRRNLERTPTRELYDALSQNLQRQGRAKDAVRLLEAAVAQRPDDLGLRFLLGAAYERLGEIDRSLEHLRVILAKDPDNAAALNFVGYVLADHGRDIDEAERLVKRALALQPDSGAILDSLGWVYFRRGAVHKAVEVLERAAALAPDEVEIIEHLGDAYQRSDRRADAARAYRRALEVLSRGDEPVDARRLRQGLERKLKNLSQESAGR